MRPGKNYKQLTLVFIIIKEFLFSRHSVQCVIIFMVSTEIETALDMVWRIVYWNREKLGNWNSGDQGLFGCVYLSVVRLSRAEWNWMKQKLQITGLHVELVMLLVSLGGTVGHLLGQCFSLQCSTLWGCPASRKFYKVSWVLNWLCFVKFEKRFLEGKIWTWKGSRVP